MLVASHVEWWSIGYDSDMRPRAWLKWVLACGITALAAAVVLLLVDALR